MHVPIKPVFAILGAVHPKGLLGLGSEIWPIISKLDDCCPPSRFICFPSQCVSQPTQLLGVDNDDDDDYDDDDDEESC